MPKTDHLKPFISITIYNHLQPFKSLESRQGAISKSEERIKRSCNRKEVPWANLGLKKPWTDGYMWWWRWRERRLLWPRCRSPSGFCSYTYRLLRFRILLRFFRTLWWDLPSFLLNSNHTRTKCCPLPVKDRMVKNIRVVIAELTFCKTTPYESCLLR